MQSDELFLHTVDHLGEVVSRPTAFTVLKASGDLRQLLLDGNRLVDVVNRPYKLQIEYAIADQWETPFVRAVLEDQPVFYSVLAGLSPESALAKGPRRKLTLSQFLAHRVMLVKGRFITVGEVIDHCANVMGGVHHGAPKKESQMALAQMDRIVLFGIEINAVSQLVAILQVVHRALLPLRDAVAATRLG